MGRNCELLIGNSCYGKLCSNNGNCIISNGKFVCNCNYDYFGIDCFIRDFCLNN